MDAAFFMIWLYEEVKTFCIMDNIKKKSSIKWIYTQNVP